MAKKKTTKKTAKKPPEKTRATFVADAIRAAVKDPEAVVDMTGGPRDVAYTTTGLTSVDETMGIGGWPHGRIIEVYGPESGGKTTFCLQIIAEAQARGAVATFVDAEHAIDPTYAAKLGVDVKSLNLSQPDSAEDCLTVVHTAVSVGEPGDVVVVDSVAALIPLVELEGDMGKSHMGKRASLLSQALGKLRGIAGKRGVTIFFINQLRMKIGVVFGNPEDTPGGRALKFYASLRIEVRRKTQIKRGEEAIGYLTRVKIVKNKVSIPFRETIIPLYFGEGFSADHDLLKMGEDTGHVDLNGSWFSFEGNKIGQGKDGAVAYLKEHPEIRARIEQLVRETTFSRHVTNDDKAKDDDPEEAIAV